jgi:uncharacterized protein YbaP (TraB family)
MLLMSVRDLMGRILAILLLLPLLSFSQSPKKYQSLLWKISGKGLKKPSYLYGTMHVSNRVAYHLSEQFFEALKSVDVVGLETNPGEWLENMEKTGELSQQNQFSNPFRYSGDFYKSTFNITFPDKFMLQGVLSYDPDIINGLLYRHNNSRENFEESTYIDLFIFQTASKLNKQVISLEDFVQSEIKARLSALPDEETHDEEEEGGRYRDIYTGAQKIEDAYRDGNLDLLDSLSKFTSTKNTQKYLINDRNVFFVNTIDSVLKTKTLFSGVGAAHLPGEDGVIELLRRKGYTVEPIVPKNTRKSDEMRDQFDLQTKSVSFAKQYISDSLFSVMVPGKLSQIVSLENVKYAINADMVNGSFYTIVRMKYSGPLSGISASQMQQRVDSLLFEHIPGKIVSRKEIVSNNGIKGLEVVNRTRRGDQQHYQIYFTDMEIILFKLGGKGEYATGSEAKTFFNSIQFQTKNENIIDFSPKTKGFSLKFPANYTYVKNNGSSVKGLVEDLYAWQKSARQFYGLKHAVYNDFDYLEEDTFEMNQFSRNVLSNFKFTSDISRESSQCNGLPCLKFHGKNKAGSHFYGMLLIKGVHYYMVYNISEKESGFNNEFFNSFKIMDFNYVNPLKEITDNDFYFKATDEVSQNSLSKFNESFSRAYDAAKGKKQLEREKKAFDFDYKSSSKQYYSPSSNEYVNIVFEKFNDYDYRTIKELDETLIKNVGKNNSMNLANIKTGNKDGLYTFQCTLKDTATRRAIELKVFLKGGMRYEISVPYDTIVGIQGWARQFFDSFTLKDTVIGRNILENKFKKLLSDLSGSDTLLRRQANLSVQNSIALQKIYLDDFIQFLGDKRLNDVSEDSRAQLFVNGGTLESERVIEPYKKLYKQYTDSFYLQLCLLKGFAYLKTQNSYNSFYQLLSGEVPLVGSADVVNDVFTILHDSLELCKKFYPGILSLTRYDEYRPAVYALLANMVNKGILHASVYESQKDNILADATLSLKRYNPNNNKSQQSDYGDYLDKVSKELAESIQASIDGLSANNMLKGSNYLKSLDALNRPELVNYAIVLAPFYKSDEKTRQFFSRLNKVKAQSIAMPVMIALLKHNVITNDTLLDYYSRNKITRAYFYSELEKEKLTDKFPKKYLSQQSLVESVVSAQRQLSSIYSYEKDKKQKDSLQFMKEVPAKNKYQQGNLYFFRIPKTKYEDEQWAVAFVGKSKHAVNSQIDMINAGYKPDKNKSEAENISEILDDFYMMHRKRSSNSGENLFYPGDYD